MNAATTVTAKPRLLICELWGVGDLVLASTLINAALAKYEVHLLAKPHARELLQPSFPGVVYHDWTAPWTAHRRKYHLWRWSWRTFAILIWRLRNAELGASVSVRRDPRDHLLMWLSGASIRVGFAARWSRFFVNRPVRHEPDRHRVESWRAIGEALGLTTTSAAPHLDPASYATERVSNVIHGLRHPIVCVHAGAALPLRRWPEHYLREIVTNLRAQFEFQLLLVPDFDGFGATLSPFADAVLDRPSLRELVDVLSRADLVLCNDSGPMHIAAACGRRTVPFFGPGSPVWFRPWGDNHKMIIRDICPYRPCRDFCRFPEPYCLTKLAPDDVWPDILQHAADILPSRSESSV